MSFKNVVGKFCKKVYDKIYNKKDFVEESKMKKEDFTRNRKVGFGDSMLIVLESQVSSSSITKLSSLIGV